jgi:phosphatidylserine/phosphatidylglycerophosphate/cardiolipin synthase-like enzyme
MTMLTSLVLFAVLSADGGVDAGVALTADAGTSIGPCSTKQALCFSPKGGCDKPLVALIDKATATLDVAIYSLTLVDVTDAILRAKARGVAVRVVIDTSQMSQPAETALLRKLADAGVPIKRNGHSGIMHMKVTIVDDTWFETGSFNYSDGATAKNDENMLIWSCPRNALIYKQKFEQMWGVFLPVVRDGGI